MMSSFLKHPFADDVCLLSNRDMDLDFGKGEKEIRIENEYREDQSFRCDGSTCALFA